MLYIDIYNPYPSHPPLCKSCTSNMVVYKYMVHGVYIYIYMHIPTVLVIEFVPAIVHVTDRCSIQYCPTTDATTDNEMYAQDYKLYINILTHTHTHTKKDTHTHKQTHKDTHTHTHTHTQAHTTSFNLWYQP